MYGGLCFGSYVLVWNKDSHWFFIPWPFAMWSPFGSRVCSFSVVTKDWQFAGVSSSVNGHLSVLWQSGHWSCFPLLYVSSSFGWVHHVRMFFPSSFAPWAFSLRVQFPEWSVQPLVAVPSIEPSSVYSHIAVQFPADSDVYF